MIPAIAGAGGGKSGGGAPTEAPDTLRSAATARIVDLIGEGEIRGPVDGLRSVFIDGVPAADESGAANFDGLSVEWRTGTPDQAPLAGIPEVETEVEVGLRVRNGAPVVRRITSADVDSVRVTLRFPRLVRYDDDGDSHGAEVALTIETRSAGDVYVARVEQTVTEKNVSPAELSWRIALPGDAPHDIRVTRLSPDSESDRLSDELWWARLTEILEVRQSYPHSAVVGITADARQFRSQLTRREYEVYGLVVSVPSNYDPSARTYTGIWDGTFARAWTDNPAWCVYDMLSNTRFGLGSELGPEALSALKWSLYEVGRWCDEGVPDGRGGTEPRWRFAGVLTRAAEARRLLDQMLSAIRTRMYWSASTVVAVSDAPSDPAALVGPANVIDGEMSVETQAWSERVSAVAVSFADPADGYRLGTELVVDDALVAKYGYRQRDHAALLCTSRSQAQRHARHILIEQEHETDRLTWRGGLDQASLRPGDVIRQHDPLVAGARLAVRVREEPPNRLRADSLDGVEPGPDDSWTLHVMTESGQVDTYLVRRLAGELIEPDAWNSTIIPGAMAVLESSDVTARLWRVESVAERDGLEFEVVARAYHPDRYAAVERGVRIEEPDLTLIPTGPIRPPADVVVSERLYRSGTSILTAVVVSVVAPASRDPRIVAHEIEVRGPNDPDYRPLAVTTQPGAEAPNARVGVWGARARYVGEPSTLRSAWAESPAVTVQGKTAPPGPPRNFLVDVLGDGTRRYRWAPPSDIDLAGIQIAVAEHVVGGTQPEWEDLVPLHTGVLTADHLETTEPQRAGAWRIAARSVDTSGIASAPVYIVAELGASRHGDVLRWDCPSGRGWPAGIFSNTERSDDGRDALEGGPDYTWADAPAWGDWESWAGGAGDSHVQSLGYETGWIDLGTILRFGIGWSADVEGTEIVRARARDTDHAAGEAVLAAPISSSPYPDDDWSGVRWRELLPAPRAFDGPGNLGAPYIHLIEGDATTPVRPVVIQGGGDAYITRLIFAENGAIRMNLQPTPEQVIAAGPHFTADYVANLRIVARYSNNILDVELGAPVDTTEPYGWEVAPADIPAMAAWISAWRALPEGRPQITIALADARIAAIHPRTILTGTEQFTGRFVQLRIDAAGDGTVPLSIDHLCWWVTGGVTEHRILDQDTAFLPVSSARTGARTLPSGPLRLVFGVDVTLQGVGAGWSWAVVGKTPPAIIIYDADGNPADATIDATIRGAT